MLQKCEGIVLRTTDYGETNKIVTLFTREWGKYGVMAKGAKKPKSRLAAITQPLTYGNYLVQKSRGMGSLQQGEIITSLRFIKEDIYLTAYASFLMELTDRALEENKSNPFLFELLLQSLSYLNEGYDPDIIKNIYEIKMLNVLGLHPALDGCASCGSKEGTFAFSIREAGILCHRCIHIDPYHLKITPATVKLLRIFYYLDMKRLGSISVKPETKAELKTVIDHYYDEYSGLFLKSKKFLEQMKTMLSEVDN